MTDTAYPTYGKPPPGLAVTGDNYDPPAVASSMAISCWTTAEQVIPRRADALHRPGWSWRRRV